MSNSVCRCILGDFVWRWCRLCPIQFVGVYWYIGWDVVWRWCRLCPIQFVGVYWGDFV